MKKIILMALLFGCGHSTVFANKVLVTIGQSGQVTEQQLESAMLAAPFASQFPAMDEKDQAYLRGDMLLRMARSEALYQEAINAGKDQSIPFNQEMGNFKTSLLAQRYLVNLRKEITIPKKLEQKISSKMPDNGDALVAARSVYVAKNFAQLKKTKIAELIKQAHVKTYFDQLNNQPMTSTLLAEGEGLSIKYGDLISANNNAAVDQQRIIEKVNEWIKLTLMAKSSQAQGENVDGQMQEYAHNLVIQLLLAEKEQQWIPDEATLRGYFQKHPKIGYIPERRQIGQIVLSSKQHAEEIQARIKAGESLFELAGQYSVDPYGRQRSGDMGWLKEGSASKEINEIIKNLQDNEVSEIIKTDKGWHLIVIVNRKPSEQKDYAEIKDRIRQKLIAEKMTVYIQEVTTRHPLQWKIDERIKIKQD